MSGLEDKDVIKANYKNMVAMTKFASHWAATAAYDLQESEDNVKHVEAFGEENSNLFNFVIANVREGLTAEEITAKANEELSELLEIEQEVKFYTFSIDAIKDIKLTSAQMKAIMFMIEE